MDRAAKTLDEDHGGCIASMTATKVGVVIEAAVRQPRWQKEDEGVKAPDQQLSVSCAHMLRSMSLRSW